MKESTKELHKKLALLGDKLGFVTEHEVSSSLLSLRIDNAYQPRIDLMWSLPLDEPKRSAIAQIVECDISKVRHLPIVGIEVEGSDPTTKTLMADTANLKSLGAPLGFLVTSEKHSKGIYRRSARAIRTVMYNLGNQSVVPLDANWVDRLLEINWNTKPSQVNTPAKKKPRGGESKKWEYKIRKHLRKLGRGAGFVIADPFIPQMTQLRFDAESNRRSNPMRHLWNPETYEKKEIKRSSDYLTECELDMGWLLPLPSSLRRLLQRVTDMDPCLSEYDIIFPSIWDHVPVVGFEFESSPGKHAGGCLLNLAAYTVIGVAYSPSEEGRRRIQATLDTYTQALGLRNVFSRTIK